MMDDWRDPEPLPPVPPSGRTLVVNAATHAGPMVMVDRSSEFGNPFPFDMPNRDYSLERFRAYFLTRVRTEPGFRQRVLALRGKTLGCWCVPRQRCHASIIAEWLDAQP